MAADLARHGIQVNTLSPGYFATEMNAALVADEDFTAWVAQRTPAGRWGRVEELRGPLTSRLGGERLRERTESVRRRRHDRGRVIERSNPWMRS
jgi:NAD(P)-dependent dehydrogenase (short-subunit alcohol dehydrogenase family)